MSSERTLQQWRDFVREMKARETSSRLSGEAKRIRATELMAAKALIDGAIEDVLTRRKIETLFAIRTKYEALDEITGTILQDDPDLARELIEKVAADDAARRTYLT